MAPKSIRTKILETLKSLGEEQFEEFRYKLRDSEEEPQIWASEVEGKNRVQISQLLVSRCSESGALGRTLGTLREIGCRDEAGTLEDYIRDLTESADNSSNSAGASRGKPAPEEHFIDRHYKDLTERVSNINPILDVLLSEKVLQQEMYEKILKISTTQDKVRALYNGPLKASRRCKDIFLQALEKQEKFLMEDLREEDTRR